MAITNMNQLFDKLQQYIDTKIDNIEVELEALFIEYGLKEIQPYLDEIKIISDNIAALIPIADNLPALVDIGENIDAILEAPASIIRMEELVAESETLYTGTVEYNENAFNWSSADFNIPVDDGTHSGYSAYHWSRIAESITYQLNLIGGWSPVPQEYPTGTHAHGDYWLVTETEWFDNIYWIRGDKLIYVDTVEYPTQFVRLPKYIDWESIANKPFVYPPEEHDHNTMYYQESEFLTVSEGSVDAGKPIRLDGNGLVHNSMIKLPVVYLVGGFTPTAVLEYPDVAEYSPGATWIISGMDGNGYTFQNGDLTGMHVYNGDYILWSASGWILKKDKLYPEDYYRRDGDYPMMGDVQVNNYKLKNVASGTETTDGVNFGQLESSTGQSFKKTEHLTVSLGVADQGKPIVLNEYGVVDASMIGMSSLVYQGGWNPASDGEYPPSPVVGYYWHIYGLGSGGFVYASGDLAGITVYNNDYILLGQNGWAHRTAGIQDPDAYYKLDGSTPLFAPFNAGGQELSFIADALIDTDAVSFGQLKQYTDGFAPFQHEHNPADIIPQGSGSLLNADMVDGLHGTDLALVDHTHPVDDIMGQGHQTDGSGLDADLLDGRHATEFYELASGVPYADLTSVPAEFVPFTATETVMGGMRIWSEGETLHIATTPAP